MSSTRNRRKGRPAGGDPQENAAIYIRVSLDRREKQDAEGNRMQDEIVSPETQEDRGRAFAHSQGWNVVMVESDIDESGYKQHYSKRKGLMRLLAAVNRREITRIIVWKFSRLSRRMQEFLEICSTVEAVGAGVVSVSETVDTNTPNGRLVRNIMASFAQFQSEELSEQIYESWVTLAKKGHRPPGRRNYGTINDQGILRPDPETHEHLLAMYRVLISTRQLAAVWDHVTAQRIKPPYAEKWNMNTLRQILSNPVYVARLEWCDEEHEGAWEPIVPVELWEQAQEILNANKTGTSVRRDGHLLTSRVICTNCGRPMWIHPVTRSQDGKRFLEQAFHCQDRHSRRGGCDLPEVDAAELDAAVWSAIQKLVARPDLDALVARGAALATAGEPDSRGRLNRLRSDEARLQGLVHQLFDLLHDGTITRDQFAQQNRAYLEQLTEIRRELDRIPAAPSGPSVAQIRHASAAASAGSGPRERGALVRALGATVEVTPQRVYLVVLGFRLNLRARLVGKTFRLGDQYQQLDYQGYLLTDLQIRFLQRTYRRFTPEAIAKRLGRPKHKIVQAAWRLRQRVISDSTTR